MSDSSTTFGTLVYNTGTLAYDSWTYYSTSFVAPVSGDYLSVMITGSPNNLTWAHIDGFYLEVVPSPGVLAMLGLAGLVRRRRR